MNNKPRKTISIETQEAIRKLLTSNFTSQRQSPATPSIGLDANFSRILKKKREEQLEASRQRLFDSTASKCDSMAVEASETQIKSDSWGSLPLGKDAGADLENSMMFGKANKSWAEVSDGEDSFLALERQCNMDDKREQLMNANDTLLFDIEPPTELWNQTINQTIAMTNLDVTQTEDADDVNKTIGISPAIRYHPLTIVEETPTNTESPKENSTSSATNSNSLLSDTASTVKEADSLNKKSTLSNNDSQITPLQPNSQIIKANRQKRGTFAFKRADYTFFPDENLMPINEGSSISEDVAIAAAVATPTKPLIKPLVDIETTPKCANSGTDYDQFNNTLERVDYLLEKGRMILDETPIANRTSHHNSLLETPLFSCKRKRLLSEMAKEMLPLPKRGPLIDFSTPEVKKPRFGNFNEK